MSSPVLFSLHEVGICMDAARDLLCANPKMKARELKAKVMEGTGQTISPASVSRLRHLLKREALQMG